MSRFKLSLGYYRSKHSTFVSKFNLKTLNHNENVASFHTLYFNCEPNPLPNTSSQNIHHNPTIDHLLQQYNSIFVNPNTLPLPCSQDHHIPTEKATDPINVKLYRYPYYQKHVMTNLISKMLSEGVIKPSQSLYSSPVLLIKRRKEHGASLSTTEP